VPSGCRVTVIPREARVLDNGQRAAARRRRAQGGRARRRLELVVVVVDLGACGRNRARVGQQLRIHLAQRGSGRRRGSRRAGMAHEMHAGHTVSILVRTAPPPWLATVAGTSHAGGAPAALDWHARAHNAHSRGRRIAHLLVSASRRAPLCAASPRAQPLRRHPAAERCQFGQSTSWDESDLRRFVVKLNDGLIGLEGNGAAPPRSVVPARAPPPAVGGERAASARGCSTAARTSAACRLRCPRPAPQNRFANPRHPAGTARNARLRRTAESLSRAHAAADAARVVPGRGTDARAVRAFAFRAHARAGARE